MENQWTPLLTLLHEHVFCSILYSKVPMTMYVRSHIIRADFTVPLFCGRVQRFVWDRHTNGVVPIIAVAALHHHLVVVWGPADAVNLNLNCFPFRFCWGFFCKQILEPFCFGMLCIVFVSCSFPQTGTPLVWHHRPIPLQKPMQKVRNCLMIAVFVRQAFEYRNGVFVDESTKIVFVWSAGLWWCWGCRKDKAHWVHRKDYLLLSSGCHLY